MTQDQKKMRRNTMTQEEFLLHYGVKGMKWGVRRRQHSLSGGTLRKTGYKTNRVLRSAGLGALVTLPLGGVGGGVVSGLVSNKRANREMLEAVYNKTGTTKKDHSRKSRKNMRKAINKYSDVQITDPKTGKKVTIKDVDIEAARERMERQRRGL